MEGYCSKRKLMKRWIWDLCRFLPSCSCLIFCCEDGSCVFCGDSGSCECGGDVICLSVMRIDAAAAPLSARTLATGHDEWRRRAWIFVGGEGWRWRLRRRWFLLKCKNYGSDGEQGCELWADTIAQSKGIWHRRQGKNESDDYPTRFVGFSSLFFVERFSNK